MTEKRARQLREVISNAFQNEEDDIVLANMLLLNEWAENVNYTIGQKIRYNGNVYRVLQAHLSQATWNPIDAPSLFAQVLTSDDGEILDWVQPDATNPYMKGDKVRFDNKIYESLIDNNVWSPADYPAGWTEIQ